MKFQSQYPHYEYLRQKWTAKHKVITENFASKYANSLKHLTVGGLGGLMMLASTSATVLPNQSFATNPEKNNIAGVEHKEVNLNDQFLEGLAKKLPTDVQKLTVEEESEISKYLSEQFNISVAAEMEGIKLNRSYGYIGGEQHLYRFPGDTVQKHAENAEDWAMYGGSGIAPGLGAWGYFASSSVAFDEKDKERERYYLAVQTFLASGFSENVGRYRDFFKYRKMIVVNPKTGQSVVAVVADAGPAGWTGKHLGGSPEVMHEVGLATGPRRGEVLYFFVDDPEDQIPLGKIELNPQRFDEPVKLGLLGKITHFFNR